MKREAKCLLEKAIGSLVLAVEIFNRPHDIGRTTATLILMDHSFEMLLKACIVHRGGSIRPKRSTQTIGFDACVGKALGGATTRFMCEEQALTARTLNSLRDAAQHHLLDISEAQLYTQCLLAFTLFRDILKTVFDQDLLGILPNRVLPISMHPPVDIITLFESEIDATKALLAPGKRRRAEAAARLRPLEILEANIHGSREHPSEGKLASKCKQIAAGKTVGDLFPNVAAVTLARTGDGPAISLRFTKKDGLPIHTTSAEANDAFVVGLRRVNELDYYTISASKLAARVGLTEPKALAVVKYLGLRDKEACYKTIKIGSSNFHRYSHNAVEEIQKALPQLDLDAIWEEYRPRRKHPG